MIINSEKILQSNRSEFLIAKRVAEDRFLSFLFALKISYETITFDPEPSE